MVNRIKNKQQIKINTEKYTLILLTIGYILGVCVGCFFVLSGNDNAALANRVVQSGDAKPLLYFMLALMLKYSGILNGAICTLPIFLGIQNSIYYSSKILIIDEFNIIKGIIGVAKDTAVVLLLIMYIIVIVKQIINKKYNLKKDIKYFIMYFCGAFIVVLLESVITGFLF